MNEDQRLFVESADRVLKALPQPSSLGPDDEVRQWSAFAELGWLALGLPESCGGLLGFTEVALLMERLGFHAQRAPLMDHLLLAAPLLAAAPTQADLFAAALEGRARVAVALWEAHQRHDWDDVQTVADFSRATVNGGKVRVFGARHATHIVVLARDAATGDRALVLLDAAAQGLQMRHYRTYDGRGCSDLILGDVPFDASHGVLLRTGAQQRLDRILQRVHVALASEAAGAMQRVLELTLEYARTRKQFGRLLTQHQAYQHALVDVYVMAEETRALSRHAAALLDGLSVHEDDADSLEAARWASGAKAQASLDGRRVGEHGVQLHGAIGMTEEYALSHHYRRLAAIANEHGDHEWHLLRMRAMDDGR